MITTYCFSIIMFMNMARYRIAILPLFSIFAAIFINSFFQKKRKQKIVKKIISFLLGIFIVFTLFPIYTRFIGKQLLSLIQPGGIVVTSSSTKIYFDNGPNFQNSHGLLPLYPGLNFCKKFAIPKNATGKTVQLQLPIHFINDSIKLKINNTIYTIRKRGRSNVVNFNLTCPNNGKFYIKNCDSKNKNIFLYIDNERNFSRSLCNNITLNGEIVTRLVINNQDSKNK